MLCYVMLCYVMLIKLWRQILNPGKFFYDLHTNLKISYLLIVNLLVFANQEQARVFQKVDNAIHRINHYPVDSVVCFGNIYPLDSLIYPLDSVMQPLNNRGQV